QVLSNAPRTGHRKLRSALVSQSTEILPPPRRIGDFCRCRAAGISLIVFPRPVYSTCYSALVRTGNGPDDSSPTTNAVGSHDFVVPGPLPGAVRCLPLRGHRPACDRAVPAPRAPYLPTLGATTGQRYSQGEASPLNTAPSLVRQFTPEIRAAGATG